MLYTSRIVHKKLVFFFSPNILTTLWRSSVAIVQYITSTDTYRYINNKSKKPGVICSTFNLNFPLSLLPSPTPSSLLPPASLPSSPLSPTCLCPSSLLLPISLLQAFSHEVTAKRPEYHHPTHRAILYFLPFSQFNCKF